MSLRRLAIVAAALIVSAVLLVLWLRTSPDEAAPSEAAVAQPTLAEPELPPSAAPVVTDASERLQLTATFLAEGATLPEQARAGAAIIRPEDLAVWEDARREGEPAPSDPLALANVARWESAALTPEGSAARLGPIDVEPAPLYRVIAWAGDGTYWTGDVTRGEDQLTGVLDAGALRPNAPTGVRIQLAGRDGSAGLSVRLSRVVAPGEDGERANAIVPVIRLARPDVASALESERSLRIEDGTVIAPLPSDAALRLTVIASNGREAEPIEVPLRAGRLEPVRIDLDDLFPGGAGRSLTLHGRVQLGSSTPLPPGAQLERLQPTGVSLPLGADGRFTVSGLPSWTTSRFALRISHGAGRPVAPARWEFEFTPSPNDGDEVERTWHAPAYGWLLLKLDSGARVRLEAHRPYPVFLLQRQDESGTWRTASADEFVAEEEGMAMSLTAPGVYRAIAAASPFDLLESSAVRVQKPEGEHVANLLGTGSSRGCRVNVSTSGRPLYGARITAAGGVGSLPPLHGLTDGEGAWDLGRVSSAGRVQLEVVSPSGEMRALDATDACLGRGEAHVAF